MSDSALKVLNSETDKKQDTNGNSTKSISQNDNSNSDSNSNPNLNLKGETVTNGSEPAIIDVEYIESENLTEISDLESCMTTLIARLDSKDWVTICEALNNVRQISIFHKEKLSDHLAVVIQLVVKSLKNPRSAVIKTALMTCSDIFKGYGNLIIDSLDNLLVQLFLKSSQDKKFVCEVAEAALVSMTNYVSASLLVPKLLPSLKNRNPRVRAKASLCFGRSVPQLGLEGIKSYGIDKLIQIAATQLSDQLPESREAARTLILKLQEFYSQIPQPEEDPSSENPNPDSNPNSWEEFCLAKLSPLSAQAILRVTGSLQKEGLVTGSSQKEGLVANC
ncbi:hypothetical protein LUZ60_015768 [Juncus effusus]|nr:hypothetical protein LUZ60_015768 [Juncus effusus]